MNKAVKRYLLDIVIVILLVFADQFTKKLAIAHLSAGPKPIISGVLSLTLLQGGNQGAAFGMLQGGFWFFMVATFVVIGLILWVLSKIPLERHFNILRFTLVLILAGALGNCCDRVVSKMTTGVSSVVDFIYIDLINFPIFNLADVCVSIGAILLIILGVFVYKENDFNRVFKKHE